MNFLIPQIEIYKELHHSDHSAVYEAFHKGRNQKVALKILREEFPSLRSIARFNEEYEITHGLKSMAVRKAVDKFKYQGRHILLLEFIEGRPLKHIIAENAFSYTQKIELAIQMAKALEEIHTEGIIHKDINPKNILVQPEGSIKIIDFGISSKIQHQHYAAETPDALEGTIAYISPEQTGRMNHSVDSRADLYSFGVTLYEFFEGHLPFDSPDQMELIHAHIAKHPDLMHNAPEIIEQVIFKLLNKNPEERYQTAFGLRKDLEKILTLENEESIFDLGEFDFSATFHIPEKLYGREEVVDTLLNTFQEASDNSLQLTLVGGYSGIGKTALINELYKPITAQRGYFISGKYDQFQRDIPYSAIIQALKDFASQILLEKEEKIKIWRKKILDTVGNNAQVIIEVVPSLELILGKQPPVPELTPTESQNRFNFVFQNFIKAISHEDHPIVLFIDDWQWADLPSINFLKLLMQGESNLSLLIIGAYRDNEVDTSHPFIIAVEELKKKEFSIQEIFLKPISQEDVLDLVSETLKSEPSYCVSLSKLIYNKTQGNPFFVNQFFKALYEENLVFFDKQEKRWEWENDKIEVKNITNNVVELMANKILKLPQDTQDMLRYAACIGSLFDLKTLSYIAGKDQKTTLNALWKAIEEGLIRPKNDNYQAVDADTQDAKAYFTFLHDRVQQAAYSLVEEGESEKINLKIGRLAYQNNDDSYRQEWICDIANYYNKGIKLLDNEEEKFLLAKINAQAGGKAKKSAAYAPAFMYFQNAILLLKDGYWEQEYDFMYVLYREASEAAYLAKKTEESVLWFEKNLQNAKSNLHKAQIYAAQLQKYQINAEFDEAYRLEGEALALLGIQVPDGDEKMLEAFQEEVGRIDILLNGRAIEDLLYAPAMTDEGKKVAMELLTMMFVTCFIAGRRLGLVWCITKSTNISLEYGNHVFSSQSYTTLGLLYCAALADPHKGYKFGRMAIDLCEKHDNLGVRSKVYHTFATCVAHWTHDPKESLYYFEEATKYGLNGGEFEYGTFAAFGRMHEAIRISLNLQELAKEHERVKATMERFNYPASKWVFQPSISQSLKNLLGQTKGYNSFDSEDFSEEEFLETYKNMPLAQAWLYSAKIRNLYIMACDEENFILLDKIPMVVTYLGAIIAEPLTIYYGALIILAKWRDLDEEKRNELKPLLEEYIEKVRLYTKNCPSHYEPKLALIEAEYAAYVRNNFWEATMAYDKAIEWAKRDEDHQQEGISAERTAKFYLVHQKTQFAQVYMKQAHYAYMLWGASAKVKQMQEKYGYMLKEAEKTVTLTATQTKQHTVLASSHTSHHGSSITSTIHQKLDMGSILKATQTISGEIKLENLLSKMLHIVIENAGAERGVLILNQNNQLRIQAEVAVSSTATSSAVLQDERIEESQTIPVLAIQYVARTKEEVLLHDASKDQRFGKTPYIERTKVKSFYCSPIIKQGEVKAILYLEHKQIAGVFTQERASLLTMLSSQMAISIDNAMIYNNLESIVEQRTKELKERNQSITDSIRYAKTIQEAILPTKTELDGYFSECFILYRPKDIVSGDFYWATQLEGRIFIAVIDCTGHGVPGAFMSMIGNTLLDEIVIQKEILNPALILEELHKDIRKALKQEAKTNADGMDMSLCSIVYAENEVKVIFAGAKRPLWYCRQGENVLENIDGDRKSIGGMQKEERRIFTPKEFSFQKGDALYLFSDGYTDQSDAEGNRFSSKRLKDILSSVLHLSMERQGNLIEESLLNFMQDTPQRDDISFLGIKL